MIDSDESMTLEDYINNPSEQFQLTTPFPESANQMTIQKILKYCMEKDANDNNVLQQFVTRQKYCRWTFRNIIDDCVASMWYLHLYNSLGEKDKSLDKNEIPVWVDNNAFMLSHKKFNINP